MIEDASTAEVPIRHYVKLILTYWLLAAVCIAAGCAVGLALLANRTPEYTAESRVYVSTRSGNEVSLDDLAAATAVAQQSVLSIAQLATSPVVLTPAGEESGIGMSADELAQRVTVQVVPNTVVLIVTARDASASSAARIANAVADQLTIVSPRYAGTAGSEGSDSRLAAVVIQQAAVNVRPTGPGWPTYVGVGGIAGAIVFATIVWLLRARRSRSSSLARTE